MPLTTIGETPSSLKTKEKKKKGGGAAVVLQSMKYILIPCKRCNTWAKTIMQLCELTKPHAEAYLLSFSRVTQSLFLFQQSSLSAALTCPLFYISDINLLCSGINVVLVVAYNVCSQHAKKKRLLVNFPPLRIDLKHILRGRISFCSRWLEGTAKERPSLKCMWAIRGTFVPSSITRLFFLSLLSFFFLLAPTFKKTNLKHSSSIKNVF